MSRSPVLPNAWPPDHFATGAWNSLWVWKTSSFRKLVIIRENFYWVHTVPGTVLSTFPNCVSVRGLQRNSNQQDIYLPIHPSIEREKEREIDFKGLAHGIVRSGKSEICRVGCRLETWGRIHVAVSSPKTIGKQNSFLFGELQTFLLRSSTDSMSPTHILESNLLY